MEPNPSHASGGSALSPGRQPREKDWNRIPAAPAAAAQGVVISLTSTTPFGLDNDRVAHTYAVQYIHCVFSTKGRATLIAEPPRLWAYMRAVARNCKVNVAAIGGTGNHVHLLMTIPPTAQTADIVRTLKANTSRWMNEIGNGFAWQDGYAAISVSPSQVPAVVQYIANQAEHHGRRTFEQEYETLLRKSGVPFDRDYLF